MKNVPSRQMYLYDKCTFMTNVPLWKCFYDKFNLWKIYLYDKCTFMTIVFITNVFMTSVSFMTIVPFMTIEPLWQVYL